MKFNIYIFLLCFLFLSEKVFSSSPIINYVDSLQKSSSSRPKYVIPLAFNYKNVRNYMFENLQYPPEAIQQEIEGEVLVRFVLTPLGMIDSVSIIKPVHPLLDSEALRLVKSMPIWKPVYFQGQPISLSYEMPVIFELLPADTNQIPRFSSWPEN